MSSASRPADWWKSAVVYQVYPRSFADSDGDGIGDIPGITSRLDYLAQLGVDVLWLSPVYRSPMDDNGYDISDYEDVDPLFGTLADLDALIAGCHERGIKLVMDLVVNHTSDEHPWFVESRDPASPKRDWYWWRPPRDGSSGAPRAPSRPTGSRRSPAPPGSTTSAAASTTCTCSAASSRTSTGRTPRSAQAVYAMMRWWVDRGVDGFRMDVINLISKDPRCPTARVPPGHGLRAGVRVGRQRPAAARVPRRDEPRGRAVRRGTCSRSARCPGSTVALARDVTDPARGELDMVFTFEHVDLDEQPGRGKWALADLPLPGAQGQPRRPGSGASPTSAGTRSTGTTTTSRGPSRASATTAPSTGSPRPRPSARCCTCTAGTPYVYQGEELGMTNAGFTDDRRLPRHRVAQLPPRGAGRAGCPRPRRCCGRWRSRAATTRAPRCSGTPPSTRGFTTGTPWLPANANHDVINAAAAVADPDSVFHHYRRLIELRHDRPGGGRRPLRAAAPRRTSRSGRSPGRSATTCCWCSPTAPREPATVDRRRRARRWTAPTVLLGTHPTAPHGAVLRAVGVAHPLAVTDSDVPLVRALEPA